MNKILSALIFVGVGGLSFGAGYLVSKRKYEKIYLDAVNRTLNIRADKLEKKEEKTHEDKPKKDSEDAKEAEQMELDISEDDIPFSAKQSLMDTYDDIASEYDTFPETDDIYVIAVYDVGLYSKYETVEVTCLKNGTLIDDDSGLEITNEELRFGDVLKKHMVELELNGELYIRNEKLKVDYAIKFRDD